jgi:hypothetical protein
MLRIGGGQGVGTKGVNINIGVQNTIDHRKLVDRIRLQCWNDMFHSDDPETASNLFFDRIEELINECSSGKRVGGDGRSKK